MRASIIILAFFTTGVLLGHLDVLPDWGTAVNFSEYVLYLLMFLVGIGIGADEKALKTLSAFNLQIFMVPLFTIAGTLLGVTLVSVFLKEISLTEVLAVGSGFGYYSLSSIIISEVHSAELGVVALLSNVMREIITLLFAPLFVKFFGKLAPIAAGGATSMDTTLPIISTSSGKEFAIIALFHGIVLTILVPFLVTFFLNV